jgi:sodium/proline symporter
MSQATAVLITLIVYKLVLIGIGFWASRRIANEADFFLGGRGVGPFVSGLSYAASTSSAWVLLGFSGFVYSVGISALWMVPGIWAGYVVMWLVIGPKLQAETKQLSHITLTDYLITKVSAGWGRAIAVLSALMIILCFIFYIAAQFDAAAKAFVDQFDLSMTESVLIGAVIILIYCLLGGFWAVSVTDTLQGIVMVVVAIGLPLIALASVGGFGPMLSALHSTTAPAYMDIWGGKAFFPFIGFAFGVASIGLGTFGQPHLMNRLMALKDDKARKQGFAIAMSWGVAVYLGMALLALAGRALTDGALADGEVLFYRVASEVLPPVLAGIVIAAILSAVMSTVDSILLAAAGAVAHDLGFNKKYAQHSLLISRSVMTAIAVLAVVLTLSLPDSIFNRVLFAWSALGAAFGPVVFVRVFGGAPSGGVVFASILAGFAVTVFFYVCGTLDPAAGGVLQPFVELAHIQGDPFERVVPWALPLILLLTLGRQKTV